MLAHAHRLLCLVAVATTAGCDDLCADTVHAVIPSPDKRTEAVIFQRDCGVGSGFNTQVALRPAGRDAGDAQAVALVIDDTTGDLPSWDRAGPYVTIEWTAKDRLRLRHDPRARVLARLPAVDGVRIDHTAH